MSHVERAGNHLVLNQFQEPEQGRGRGERTNAQRVEEVRHKADAQLDRPRSDGFAICFTPHGGKPGDQVESGEAAERDKEPGFDGKHAAYAIRVGRKSKPRGVKESGNSVANLVPNLTPILHSPERSLMCGDYRC